MNRVIVLLLTIATAPAIASPFGFKKGRFDLFTEGSTVSTSRNFNDDGLLYQLPGINHLQEVNLLFGSSYDFGNDWALRIESNVKQINAQSNQVYTYNYNTTAVADVTLGGDFSLGNLYGFKIIPDISVFIPVSGVPGDDSAAFLNDGAVGVTAKVYFAKDFWILKNSFYGGFNWRSQGYSSQIPLGILARANLGSHFFLDLKTFGEISMNNDQYSSAPSNRNIKIMQFNGGSLMYAGVNPSFFSVKAALGWNISSSWSLSAGLQQSIWGIRAPDETRILALLKYSSSGQSQRARPKFQSDDHDQFEVDTEE